MEIGDFFFIRSIEQFRQASVDGYFISANFGYKIENILSENSQGGINRSSKQFLCHRLPHFDLFYLIAHRRLPPPHILGGFFRSSDYPGLNYFFRCSINLPFSVFQIRTTCSSTSWKFSCQSQRNITLIRATTGIVGIPDDHRRWCKCRTYPPSGLWRCISTLRWRLD